MTKQQRGNRARDFPRLYCSSLLTEPRQEPPRCALSSLALSSGLAGSYLRRRLPGSRVSGQLISMLNTHMTKERQLPGSVGSRIPQYTRNTLPPEPTPGSDCRGGEGNGWGLTRRAVCGVLRPRSPTSANSVESLAPPSCTSASQS